MTEENNTTTQTNEPSLLFSEQDREFASRAKQEYETEQYDACLKTLQKLAESCSNDPKVLFNIALTEFALSNFEKTEIFKVQLHKIAERLNCNLDNVETLEEPDQCPLFYTIAVLLYQMREYSSALAIVEKLFRLIDQTDETFSWKISLLLAELYLCTFQPESALNAIGHLEKLLNERSNCPTSNGLSSHSPNPSNENLESIKTKSGLAKIRCFLMLRNLRVCKKDLKQLQTTNMSSTSLTYSRAYFEYLKENHVRALKILTNNQTNSPLTTTENRSSHCFFNNLSCIHFHMHKTGFALFYMRRALEENLRFLTEHSSNDDQSLFQHHFNRKYEILYNLGIQLLFKRQPADAFECLIEVVSIYSTNIRLWLRLAECCIMIHRSSNDEIFKEEQKLKCVSQSIGTGFHHKVILGNCTTSSSAKKSSINNENPTCSMDFAFFCLKNALMLFPKLTEADFQTEETKLFAAPPGNPLKIGEMIALKCSILIGASYVSLCLNDFVSAKIYATNLLDEPRAAPGQKYLARLYLSESQLAMNKIDLALKQLDENVVKTDNDLSFKIVATNVDKNEEKAETSDVKSEISSSWLPSDARVARGIVFYNIAVIYAISNDVEKAYEYFNSFVDLFGKTQPAHSFHLKFYLDLLDGNRHRLQILLKEHFRHLTSNKTFVALPIHPMSNSSA